MSGVRRVGFFVGSGCRRAGLGVPTICGRCQGHEGLICAMMYLPPTRPKKWPKTAKSGPKRPKTAAKGPKKKDPKKKDPKKRTPKKERGGAHPARYPRHARGGSGARPPADRLRSYSRGRRQAAWPAAAQRAHRPRTRSGRGRPRGAALGWKWEGMGAALMGRRWGGLGRDWGRL